MNIVMMQADTAQAVDIVWKTLNQIWVDIVARMPFIVIALIVMLVFWAAGRLIQKGLLTAGRKTRLDTTLASLLGRIAGAAMFILGLLVGAVIVFPGFGPGNLVAGLGITSVAIGFAFKDVLQNFFAGLLILWRRPFVVGDTITIDDFEGVVEEINVRATRIRTHDSERAIIPNGDVYTSALVVQTAYAARRLHVDVGIGYQDDIEQARGVIDGVARRTDGVREVPEPFVVLSELAAYSVNMRVYFYVDSSASAVRMRDKVATGIKYALDSAGIEMPYPHSVVVSQPAPEPASSGQPAEHERRRSAA